MTPTRRTAILALTAVAALAALATAGDLNPPAGPVAETMKPLDEVEPRIAINAENTPPGAFGMFAITQPGSYYLTGNITGVPNKSGIEIAADNVSIDLMGFELRGVPGSNDGIICPLVGAQSVSVRNGTVSDWSGDGLSLNFAEKARIDSVRSIDNAADGFAVGAGATVTNCVASGNNKGFRDSGYATFARCTAIGSTQEGFDNGTRCLYEGCIASNNGATGFDLGFGTTVNNCQASDNSGSGIVVLGQSTVTNCSSTLNTGDGIRGGFWCTIRDNACQENQGAGVHVDNEGGRVEGNHCAKNFTGILVTGAYNYIVRNTCYDSLITNYDIAINNRYGEIVDVSGLAAPAVSGDAAPGVLGSTDPWANLANASP